jgi:hypothetical protein
VSAETRALIDGLDFPLTFLGKWRFPSSYRKFHPLVYALGRLYHPVARYRMDRGDARFPLESKLVRAFGLFGRQG